MRKHTQEEIQFKLSEAENLTSQGLLQSRIAQSLDISVMTLHRWRRKFDAKSTSAVSDFSDGLKGVLDENRLLRSILVELVLDIETIKIENRKRLAA